MSAQSNLDALNGLLARNEAAFKGWAGRVVDADLDEIAKIDLPRDIHQDLLRLLFFPRPDDTDTTFGTLSRAAFKRPG